MAASLSRTAVDPIGNVWRYVGLGNPQSAGFAAGVGSTFTQQDSSPIGRRWVKTGSGDTAWIPADFLGTVEGSLTTLTENREGVYRTQLTFADRSLAVTDALAYAGTKVFTFPQGRIYVLGAVATLTAKVTTANTTINDSADMDYSFGQVTAPDTTLGSTEADIIPKVDIPLSATNGSASAAASGVLAAPAYFDGTTTALPVFLNVAFPTGTQIDADGTLAISGTLDLVWAYLGDY